MEALLHPKPQNTIQWKQLWSLAALYGSIAIGWIAYQNYQPKLLDQFHFTDFTFILIVAEALILVITPPLAGKLGDRYRFKKGHRIPVITAGISFAAMIFMAVAFTLFSNPGEIFKWILPVLIVFWLIAMSIFTSPALSTMELFMPVDKLPRAMAILTIVGNLIYSLEPVIVDIIDFIGAPLTFMAGGTVVLVSGLALKKSSLILFKTSDGKEERPIALFKLDTQRSNYSFIFFLGAVMGFVTTILFTVFPDVYAQQLHTVVHGVNGKIASVSILGLSALISIPISNVVNKYGLVRSFWLSFGVIIFSIVSIVFLNSIPVVLMMTVMFSISFTALSVSSLPLAMERSNYFEKVFCVGIFFSGVALPDGVLQIIMGLRS
jgi:MFS family permease